MVAIKTAFRRGVGGEVSEIEAVKTRSLPALIITGLVGDIVRESRERILGCFATLGFGAFPTGRVVIHLSPAGEKKQGSHFDLAIALAVLAAESKITPESIRNLGVLGELTLDGRIREIENATLLIDTLSRNHELKIIVPSANAPQAGLVDAPNVWIADTLSEVLSHLNGASPLRKPISLPWSPPVDLADPFRNIIGQGTAKRALQIAVSGRHHLLMMGSPGIGKSMLAASAAEMQPVLTREELIEVARINDHDGEWRRPFRSPHHSISASAFLGGGSGTVIPGEVTLAHRGILFMDELPEFRRDAIEGLREPLESGKIHVHRIGRWHCLPARFTLIAAMNPCPCGYWLESSSRCLCADEKRLGYQRRISGPIFDRIDMTVVMKSKDASDCSNDSIEEAVGRQRHRYRGMAYERNGEVPWGEHWEKMQLPPNAEALVRGASPTPVSLRAIHKVLRVARTVADLYRSERITSDHIYEAWEMRWRNSVALASTSSAI